MANEAQVESLLQRLIAMVAGDISTLEASCQLPDSSMSTTRGSPNDLLWSDMEKLGWMTSADAEHALPSGGAMPLRIFTISPAGREPISELIRKRLIVSQMTGLYNGLCRDFPIQLVQQVRAGGGSPKDVLTLLSGVIAKVLGAAFTPEDREKALNMLVTYIKPHLREKGQ